MKMPTNRKLIFSSRLLLIINLAINLLLVLFFVPAINYAIKFSMQVSHQSYITQANIVKFLVTPVTLLLLLLSFIIIPFFLLSKIYSLIYYCNLQGKHKHPYFVRIVGYGIIKTISTIRKKNTAFIYYSIPFYIFTLLPVIIGIAIYADLGFRLSLQQEIIIKIIFTIVLLVLSLLFYPYAFVIQYGMLKGISRQEALRRSKTLFMGNVKKMLRCYYSTNLQLFIAYFLFYYLLLFLIAIMSFLFTDRSLAVSVFLSAYPKINFFGTILYGMFAFVINMNLLNSLFHNCQKEDMTKAMPNLLAQYSKRYLAKAQDKYMLNAVLIGIVILSVINFYITIHNDSLYLSDALSGVQISSHRGNSHISPENTIPALENAILAQSDYAEIDVQETKDGTLVLLHDNNLYRTAGINKNIWNITYDEVSMLDVGSWFGDEFINTRIPTLEEALQLCKGKIKLNIEVKYSKKSPDIVEKLVALIEQYEFVDQCVVSSASYSSLIEVKLANENIKTGYILSSIYGIYHNKAYIDFYSIRSSFITKSLVDSAHKSGKEIHAWTVNSPKELERLKAINVDCVITDNPTRAREVLYRDDANISFIQLIKRMYVNRALYSLNNFNN